MYYSTCNVHVYAEVYAYIRAGAAERHVQLFFFSCCLGRDSNPRCSAYYLCLTLVETVPVCLTREQDKAVKYFGEIVRNPGMKYKSVSNLDE